MARKYCQFAGILPKAPSQSIKANSKLQSINAKTKKPRIPLMSSNDDMMNRISWKTPEQNLLERSTEKSRKKNTKKKTAKAMRFVMEDAQ